MDVTEDTAEWLAREMREIRRRIKAVKGLSINQVLQRAGVSYSTWWRWDQYTMQKPGGQVARMDRLNRVKNAVAGFETEQASTK